MKSFLLILIAVLVYAQYGRPGVVATIAIPELEESSGIIASRRFPGVFWTHNDSGNDPYLYAFDRTGKSRGRWLVTGTQLLDWEDIAMGPGDMIYAGDIGDNDRDRDSIRIVQIPEPPLPKRGGIVTPFRSIQLRYPDHPHDAEAMFVHPRSGDIYIVTKARGTDKRTIVYKSSPPHSGMLRYVADIHFPQESDFALLLGRVTGAGISPDGRRVVLCDYFRGWEAVLPDSSAGFDKIWKQEWHQIDLGLRPQGEAVCYRHDGMAILTTSEGRSFPLIEVERQH